MSIDPNSLTPGDIAERDQAIASVGEDLDFLVSTYADGAEKFGAGAQSIPEFASAMAENIAPEVLAEALAVAVHRLHLARKAADQ